MKNLEKYQPSTENKINEPLKKYDKKNILFNKNFLNVFRFRQPKRFTLYNRRRI